MFIWGKWAEYLTKTYGKAKVSAQVRAQLFNAFVAGFMLCRQLITTQRITEVDKFIAEALTKIEEYEKLRWEEVKEEQLKVTKGAPDHIEWKAGPANTGWYQCQRCGKEVSEDVDGNVGSCCEEGEQDGE